MPSETTTLSAEQWTRLREIYARVLDAPEAERNATVLGLCEGDSEMEYEVRCLLSAHREQGSFLEELAVVALNCLRPVSVPSQLVPGTILAARFEILRLINTGGMGAVYESWDTELQEVVALKTIRSEIAAEPSVIEHFKEEVRHSRQISHSNICRVYDLFSHEYSAGYRIWFLTMQ